MIKIQTLIRDKSLLYQAMQIPAHGHKAGYERLEFLGDRVIGLVVAEMLYVQFPKEEEGLMAKRFVALTCEDALAEIAREMELPQVLVTNEEQLRNNDSILSDVVEALMAALYLDQGLEKVKEFMIPLWKPLLLSEQKVPQDSKSALQELAQQKYKQLPSYVVINQIGEDHNPQFTVEVSVGQKKAQGVGHSKKQAEKKAAEILLKELNDKR